VEKKVRVWKKGNEEKVRVKEKEKGEKGSERRESPKSANKIHLGKNQRYNYR